MGKRGKKIIKPLKATKVTTEMQVKIKRAQKLKQKERSESGKKMTDKCQEILKDNSGVQKRHLL